MGLDSVEIVMELEDHFGVRLEDDAVSRTRTVGDLARLVTERLPMVEAGAVCLTARTFYQVRAVMKAEAKLSRRVVRPSAKLEEILPKGQRRRAVWRAMARELGSRGLVMPELTWSTKVKRRLGAVSGGMFVVWLAGSVVLGVMVAWWSGVVFFAVALPVLIAGFLMVDSRFGYELPSGIQTVGELARRLVPRVVVNDEGEREAMGGKVMLEVREIIARQLNMKVEDVKAESRLREDLAVG